MTVTTAGEAKKDFMKYKIDEQFRPLDLLGHKPLNRAKLAASNIFLKNFFRCIIDIYDLFKSLFKGRRAYWYH